MGTFAQIKFVITEIFRCVVTPIPKIKFRVSESKIFTTTPIGFNGKISETVDVRE